MGYTPPFTLTEEMLEYVSDIMEVLGQISNVNDLDKLPRLRRAGRIRSVHSRMKELIFIEFFLALIWA